jgi:hypothetical protein
MRTSSRSRVVARATQAASLARCAPHSCLAALGPAPAGHSAGLKVSLVGSGSVVVEFAGASGRGCLISPKAGAR